MKTNWRKRNVRNNYLQKPDPDGVGPLGPLITSYEYDPLARLKKVTDPRNSITQYEYNWRGQITKLTDPLSNDTSWAYDPLGRLSSETNELNASRTYLWDAGDRLTSLTDRRGWVSTFDYDNLDRVVKERWHEGNTQSPVVNTINMYYNDAGLLSDINDNQAGLSYSYDGLDRLVSETASYTGTSVPVLTTMYAFGNRGQRQSTTFKVGVNTDRTEEYGYDDLGRMTWQNRTGGGGALRAGWHCFEKHGLLWHCFVYSQSSARPRVNSARLALHSGLPSTVPQQSE